jgi:hypothetical protein
MRKERKFDEKGRDQNPFLTHWSFACIVYPQTPQGGLKEVDIEY